MKMKQAFTILFIILLGAIFIQASTRTNESKTHEYISIYYSSPHIKFTKGTEEYISYKLKKNEIESSFDTREIFKLIGEYEKEGYRLIESNAFNTGGEHSTIRTYYLLQK